MPKKTVLFFAFLILVACVVGYRLGSSPVARAQTLPTAPATWTLSGSSTYKQSAIITQPAVAGAQHVITCIAFSMSNHSTGVVYSTAILRNGPSLTGTALWQYNFAIEPGASVDHSVCDLNIVASVDTPVTLETDAYSDAIGSFVNLVGYDAQ
jgi:hypothetical protein